MDPLVELIIKTYGPWGISLSILIIIVKRQLAAAESLTKNFREELAFMRVDREKDREIRHTHNESLMAMLKMFAKAQAAKEQTAYDTKESRE